MTDDNTRIERVTRPISPLFDYIERADDGKFSVDRDYVEFNCPLCEYSISPGDIVYEGGGKCPGCGARVELFIKAVRAPPDGHERNNIPPECREKYR